MRRVAAVMALAGCSGAAVQRPTATLRRACTDRERWDNASCVPRGDAAAQLAAGKDALADQQVELATAAIDAAAKLGPLDHEAHIMLWEQRGIAAAFTDDVPAARGAFEMLLALDPGHFLSYLTSPRRRRCSRSCATKRRNAAHPLSRSTGRRASGSVRRSPSR